MLKLELVQTDKHSIKILLRRKNLRFLRRTNHYTNTLEGILSGFLPTNPATIRLRSLKRLLPTMAKSH
jgi:hypothetical protein